MLTLYLTAAICNSLLFTSDVIILTYPHLSIKKYLIFFLSTFALCFMHAKFYFSFIVLVLLAVNSLLLLKFTGKPYSVFYFPLGYITNCIVINMVSFAANMLWDISVKELNSTQFLIITFAICTFILSCPVLYLVRRLFRKYLINIFEKMNRKLSVFIALTLILCAFMVFTMASFFDTVDITHTEYFLMASSLILYSLFTMSMLFIVLHSASKTYEAREKVEYLENLNEYTRNLEMVYNNLRSFRHDYINIMASLSAYIDEKKYEELETFFYEHILPMQKNLTQKNSSLDKLFRISLLELKSILYTKLLLAVNQDIEVNIDIPDEIDSIHMDPVDLTRMLGIYLDNAIEACLETEHPVLNFHLGKTDRDIVFIISNTFIDKGLSIAQMYKKDITTKGEGHGIGLHNVSEILNRYDNISHETLIEDGLFIQQVQIS